VKFKNLGVKKNPRRTEMIKQKYISLVLIVLLVFSVSAFAGSEARIGTAGAQELLIPVGARGIGLNGANIADIYGVEAMYWNPAGLAGSQNTEAMFSYMNWIADINVSYLAVGTRLGRLGSLGLSVKSLGVGDIPVTTTDLPDGTGETYSPQFIVLGATYSKMMTDRINFGFTFKIIHESITQMSASGICFDFGVQYRNILPGVNFGVTLKSLGPNMKYSGINVEEYVTIPGSEPGSKARPAQLVLADFDLPVTFEIGLGYRYNIAEEHAVNVYGDFQNFNFGNDEYKGGIEYGYKDFFFLRGGYLGTQHNTDNIFGPTLGAGVNANFGVSQIGFDYTYRSVDYFDANQFFSLHLSF
jgi:hypothetical protein